MPVNVTGFDDGPERRRASSTCWKTSPGPRNRRAARTQERADGARAARATSTSRWKACSIASIERAKSQTLNIILRADVRGSIEAIQKELAKLEHPEVKVKLLQKSVGGITEADVTLADASDAIIIGFNVVPDEKARVAGREDAACRFAATT